MGFFCLNYNAKRKKFAGKIVFESNYYWKKQPSNKKVILNPFLNPTNWINAELRPDRKDRVVGNVGQGQICVIMLIFNWSKRKLSHQFNSWH